MAGRAARVIYLDPMFPHRDKERAGEEGDAPFPSLCRRRSGCAGVALRCPELASHRVVVKRPRKAPAIDGSKPGYSLEGKSSRYDIYPKKKLQA